MKSTQVYGEAKTILAPWCKAEGFKRIKSGMLGWQKQVADKFLTFWLQCSGDGWDFHAGSKFAVEFQLSGKSIIGDFGLGCSRKRLPYFLTADDLNEVRQIQNDVIASLSRPPSDYFIYMMSPQAISWYLAKFDQVDQPYLQTEDIWLRYHQPEHVRRWADFLLRLLPRIVAELSAKAN